MSNVTRWIRNNPAATIITASVLVIVGISLGVALLSTHSEKKVQTEDISDGGSSIPVVQSTPQSTTNNDPMTPAAPKVYTGTGDDVIDIQKPNDGAAIVKFECSLCEHNTVLKTNGPDSLLVNTIESYKGTVPMLAPAFVQVLSTGSWSVTPE